MLSSQDLSPDCKRRRVGCDAPVLSAPIRTEPRPTSFPQPALRDSQGPPQRSGWAETRFERRPTNDFLDSPKPVSLEVGGSPFKALVGVGEENNGMHLSLSSANII